MNNNDRTNDAAMPVVSKRVSKRGAVAASSVAIIVVITIFLNLIVGQLPTNLTELDISSQQFYTVSDISRDFLKTLDKDIELVLFAAEEDIDDRIMKFVSNYAALSDHVTYRAVDPVLYPSVLEEYEGTANSLVVSCAETGRRKAIDFEGTTRALILTGTRTNVYDYSTTVYQSAFDADGQITSAINFVTNPPESKIYLMEGHDETALPVNCRDLINKANVDISTSGYDLLLDGDIPEDCSLLMCINPTLDLSDDEVNILSSYLEDGGRVMIIMNTDTLTNFNDLLLRYGLEVQHGGIGDASRYYQQYASYYGFYCIAPILYPNHPITAELTETNAITVTAYGMLQTEPVRDSIDVEGFLYTSSSGVRYVSEEDYTEDTVYTLGATATEKVVNAAGEETSSILTAITTYAMFDDSLTGTYPNMANLNIFINAVTNSIDGATGGISIPSKSLTTARNTISNYTIWNILFVGVIPVAVLTFGLVRWLRRRKRK